MPARPAVKGGRDGSGFPLTERQVVGVGIVDNFDQFSREISWTRKQIFFVGRGHGSLNYCMEFTIEKCQKQTRKCVGIL